MLVTDVSGTVRNARMYPLRKNAWRIVFLIGLVSLALFICYSVNSRHEPSYAGKSLSQWMLDYESRSPPPEEAVVAIRQIGTNGIPYFLTQMRASDSGLKKLLRKLVPFSWHDNLSLRDISWKLRRRAADGLSELGTNGAAAVPVLLDLASQHPDELGVESIRTLGALGASAEVAIPFLIQCLTNRMGEIRVVAADALSNIQRRPEIVIPALIQYLAFTRTLTVKISTAPDSKDMNFELHDALISIVHFRSAAKAAVPSLVSLLEDQDPIIRSVITNWLPVIDAEAAAKANIR